MLIRLRLRLTEADGRAEKKQQRGDIVLLIENRVGNNNNDSALVALTCVLAFGGCPCTTSYLGNVDKI